MKGLFMETRKYDAAEKKRCGKCNCAQAVICTYCDKAGIDEGTACNIGNACAADGAAGDVDLATVDVDAATVLIRIVGLHFRVEEIDLGILTVTLAEDAAAMQHGRIGVDFGVVESDGAFLEIDAAATALVGLGFVF